MANITTYLNDIKNAVFGKEVRGSIHNGIDVINKEVESTTSRQVDLESTFDQLIINAGNSNAEIVDARVGDNGTSYAKLGDRLNKVDEQFISIGKKISFVTPEMFYFENNEDYTLAFQRAIDYCKNNNNVALKSFGGKIYNISNELRIDFNINIDLNNSELIPLQPINSIININSSEKRIMHLSLKNIVLRGNGLCKDCLYLDGFSSGTFENLVISGALENEIKIESTKFQTNECVFNNIRLRRDVILPGTENCNAIFINCTDSYFNNIVSVNYKNHLNIINGVNWFNEAHGWNSSTCDSFFNDTCFIKTRSEIHLNMCNCSGMNKVFNVASNVFLIKVNNSTLAIDYIPNGLTTKNYIFYIDSEYNPTIKVIGCFILGLTEQQAYLTNVNPVNNEFYFSCNKFSNSKKITVFEKFINDYRIINDFEIELLKEDAKFINCKATVTNTGVATISSNIEMGSIGVGTVLLAKLPKALMPNIPLSKRFYFVGFLMDSTNYAESCPIELDSTGYIRFRSNATIDISSEIRFTLVYNIF